MIVFYLLVTVMPMLRHPLWSDLIGDLTIIKYLGLASLGYAIFYLPQRQGRIGFFDTAQARLFFAFAILVIALSLKFGDPSVPVEISPVASFTSFLGFFFVTLVVVDSVARLRWVLLMAVGSVAYASLHILREWQKYGGMAAGYRPGWVTGDPNYYSVSALLTLPIAVYLLRTKQERWERLFCVAAIVLTILGMTLAASRGGFVGMVVASLVMALHSKRRFRTITIVLVLTVPLMAIAPSSPLTRILSPDAGDEHSTEQRTNLAKAGLAMFQDNVLFGIGPGNFKNALDRYANYLEERHIAHNSYIEVMAEMGLPGIALFLLTITATLVNLARVRRHARSEFLRNTAEALTVGLVGFLVAALFVSAEAHRFLWFITFVTMVLPTLDREATEPAPEPAPAVAPLRRLQEKRSQ